MVRGRCQALRRPLESARFSAVYASESRGLAVPDSLVHLTAEARSMQLLLYELTLPKRARMAGSYPACSAFRRRGL